MKVVISARNFVFEGCRALELLKDSGFEVCDVSDRAFNDEDEYLREIIDADAVINAFEPMSRSLLSRCEKLKLISVRGVGYDYIDAAACKELGVDIARTVGTVGEAVSEQAVAYIMHFARQIDRQNRDMQNGVWRRIMTDGVFGKSLGIVGFGEIGQALAKKADALGMRVSYNCTGEKVGVKYEFKELDELLKSSDYVVLALPLTAETKALINKNALEIMKSDAVLINVARSKIVDNTALKNAVQSGVIRGAAVDVFDSEPCTDSELSGCDNIILTPHTAPFTKNNFIAMNTLAVQNIINYFNGSIDKKYLV
ncbi:MAG: 3-phosphoglycerate dehydrogenase [Eubacterium sp.]|nr:3-phosphoglycerate dehydrogenase [Eubacterium sp.]